jgi:hypothetical protein
VGKSEINSKVKINGQVNIQIQNSPKFYKLIKEILQNREIPEQCKTKIYIEYLTLI